MSLSINSSDKIYHAVGEFFAFPTALNLANRDEDFYKIQGLGYSAEYIYQRQKAFEPLKILIF